MSENVLDTMIGMREAATDPTAASAHYRTALELEAAGDRPAAVDELRKAIQWDNNPEHHFKLAYFLDLVGEEDEAVALYEQICDEDRPHMNALLNLAVLYEDRGQINEAEKCLRQILDTNPSLGQVCEALYPCAARVQDTHASLRQRRKDLG